MKQIKILLLEDSPSDAKLLQYSLKRDGMNFETIIVDTKEQFVESLHNYKPDVILSDHQLGLFNSQEALQLVQQVENAPPFILVTGTVSEEFAVSIIKRGATDYILKGNLSRLPTAIRSALAQKEANERLRKSEEQFQQTIDGMIDGVQIIGYDWRYLYVNNIVARQGKYSKEDLLDHTMMEKYPGIENTYMFSQLQKCMTERVIIEIENEFTYPDGEKAWFKLNIQPSPQGILIVSNDITEKRKSFEQLKIQNKRILDANNDLDRFLYSVSHELRTPICNGLGLIHLMRSDTHINGKHTEILERLETSILDQDTILQQIGTFTEAIRNSSYSERINFRGIIQESLRSLENSVEINKVEIQHTEKHEQQPHSNNKVLLFIFNQLISNGVKFRNASKPHIKIQTFTDTKTIRIIFSDNGIGIKKENKHEIFKPFYRTGNSSIGKGLGLFFTKKVVETLGGEINFSSETDIGTTFEIILPNNQIEVNN